jgi:hypothetical protein
MKPENHDASPLKAELQAFYSALLMSHPSNIITLRYDCETIKNLVDFFSRPRLTQRQILKTPNYPLVKAIMTRIGEIDTPINYVKIPRVLNEADIPSKTARQRQDTQTHMIQHPAKNDYQVVHNEERTNTYPRKLLKQQRQHMISAKTNQKVGNLWGEKITSRINHTLTLRAIDKCLDRTNSMDTTNYLCQTFRTSLNQCNLQTLDKRAHYKGSLLENDFCLRCGKNITEDQDHLFECEHSIQASEEIYERGIELFHSELEKDSDKCVRESANRALVSLGISPQNILMNTFCAGILNKKGY